MHSQETYVLAILAFALLFLLSGCADIEDPEEAEYQQASDSDAEAKDALERAESAMMEAGIEADFDEQSDIETMTDLHSVLPDPTEITQLEKQQKMEEAIKDLYIALDALGGSGVSLAPSRELAIVPGKPTKRDLALIHLHLCYCYIISAVSRLARAGIGPDGVRNTGDELYYIKFSKEPQPEILKVYGFEMTARGQRLMDSVNPDIDPDGYIRVFYRERQVNALQAVIDSLRLLLGIEMVVIGNPLWGIKPQEPMVNELIYRHSASYHLDRAKALAREIAPKLEDDLDKFDEIITERFSREILENAVKWGLKIRRLPISVNKQ